MTLCLSNKNSTNSGIFENGNLDIDENANEEDK